MYAEVIVDISHEAIDKSFSYRIPEDTVLHVGDPVLVPFGRGKKKAYVLSIHERVCFPEEKIKDIDSVLDKEFSVEEELLALAVWMSREYGTGLNQCLKTVIPVKKKVKKRGKATELLWKAEEAPLSLTEEQANVLEGIKLAFSKGEKAALLFGVTGSGKTEVYLKLMEEIIRKGKEVIFLIPEISLSFQTRSRIEKRFPGLVSVLHSKMSQGERAESMEKCRSGEVKILMGPRSALFAPFSNLGLIIMDEEQDRSYKSELAPRYETRDVIRKRGELSSCPVLFGSATPSVQLFSKVENGKLPCFCLYNRAVEGSTLPKMQVVDMRKELEEGNRSIFSRVLEGKIQERLNRGEQVMLFMNRRGYAPFVSCRKCGEALRCPHCDVSLNLHKNGILQCHYCGYQTNLPKICPNCKSKYLAAFGTGTEKLESICHSVFPKAGILRMDRDSTGKKGKYEEILQAFSEEKADILLGTQMIVKGHDFPKVTLVGIIAVDQILLDSDFQAGEWAYQLITQVSGRAGRGERAGEVLIQSYQPDHPLLELALKQDYLSFYKEEKNYRKRLSYPPFSVMLAMQCIYTEEAYLDYILGKLMPRVQERIRDGGGETYGPFPATVYKIKDKFRKIIYIKHSNHDIILQLRDYFIQELKQEDKRNLILLQFDLL
ncbi:replication restart helicase PriA [Oribacterium asaccharolyticum]|uniref:replication restart helicase PriA n=1 Tax=Oribacterium asaccharolyticum TaxID=1501332 RepID=UPI0028EA19F1|nr:primosomal protein N' [Oribacterium asaccharolyticum]